jgi:8-oxo-dGTP diphosphatase
MVMRTMHKLRHRIGVKKDTFPVLSHGRCITCLTLRIERRYDVHMPVIPTQEQVSAGGVVFRRKQGSIEIILISVGASGRWQLPKGLIEKSETPQEAAAREVGEETGTEAALVGPIDPIEYWFYGASGGRRVRFHKLVYFYLFEYRSGNVKAHDHEVNEARWVEISQGHEMLAFKSEKKIVEKARAMLDGGEP